MKQELSEFFKDLTPVHGLMRSTARANAELELDYAAGINGEISFGEFNWRCLKNFGYNLCIAGWNCSLAYGAFKAVEYFSR